MTTQIEDSLSDGCFSQFLQLTYALTGITISESRKSMLISRLRKRLVANGLTKFEDYLAFVQTNPAETARFIDNMTTNETYFFRTPRIWSYLIDEFVPQFTRTNPCRPMRLWSAAASTGEEAHTAGVLFEATRERLSGFDYRILGTDISPRVIDVAQKGLYSGRSIERFREARPDIFKRFLAGSDSTGFSVTAPIRERLRFETHNLFVPTSPGTGFDVVMLRNVLIYFSKADQERVLEKIRRTMNANSILIIGESETLSSLSTGFKSIAPFLYAPCQAPAKAAA